MKFTQHEQVLYNLRMRHSECTRGDVEEWTAQIGFPELVKMSAAAAIALSKHESTAGDDKYNIVTAMRVVCDILHDLEILGYGEEMHNFTENPHMHFDMLTEYHTANPAARHCHDEIIRNVAAAGILPLTVRRNLWDYFKDVTAHEV